MYASAARLLQKPRTIYDALSLHGLKPDADIRAAGVQPGAPSREAERCNGSSRT